MALIANEWPEKYGGVLLDGDGAVTGFTRRGDRRPSFHFIGVQAAEADVFAGLDDGVPAESVLGVYPRLMASRPDAVRGFVSTARFQDIGTPRDLLTTSLALAAADGRGSTAVGTTRLGRRDGDGRALGAVGRRRRSAHDAATRRVCRRRRRDDSRGSAVRAVRRSFARTRASMPANAWWAISSSPTSERYRAHILGASMDHDRRMPGRRATGSTDTCERSGLAARSPRVVPLTGDASDRRYFRVLLPDAPSIVLALYSAPFDVRSLPFVNVATLLATDAGADPRRARTRRRSRRARAAGSRRRHAAGAPRRGDAGASTRRCTARPWR